MNVLVQPEKDSSEAMATEFFSSRSVRTWKRSSSRQAYYAWLKRYEAEGFEGLKDRSSASHHSPTATDAEVIEKILWLRHQYHFGPEKITMYLKRYHDVTISASGFGGS